MKNFAVIGNPVAHSKSPEIFRNLFKHFSMDCHYTAVSMDRGINIPGMMIKYDLSGINITSPFKEEAFRSIKNTDPVSKKIGAVNVIIRRNDSFYGFNTDTYGVTHSIINNGIDIKNKKCIVLGAGGAAKSAIYSVYDLQGIPFVCNRTDSKAEKISGDFDCGFIRYDDLKEQLKDTYLFISTVPETDPDLGNYLKNVILLNANYRDDSLKDNCRRYIDGYEWLIYQAVKTFENFFDIKADISEIRKDLFKSVIKKNIALIGPTGSGKSTYGKIIAECCGMEFIDTDDEIESITGMKIFEIFQTQGEDYFRHLEENIIAEAVRKNGSVISAGAGAFVSAVNREKLKENSYVILLDAGTDLIISRLNKEEVSKRPKLKVYDVKEELDKMFANRKDGYISSADLMISVTTNDAVRESEKIIRELDARQ